MIGKKNISEMNTNHHLAFDYLESKFNKNENNHRVLDIGAGANPWSVDWVTHIVDLFVEPKDEQKVRDLGVKVFNIDAQDSMEWQVVLDDVEKNGKFDFVICSHTLEDVHNPKVVCQMINRIGKAGFISMPSKYAELTQFESYYDLPYCGYHHHRWIYQIRDNVLIGHPKMNFHDHVEFNFTSSKPAVHTEIAFLWEDNFEYELIYSHQMLDNRDGPNRLEELFIDDDLILT